MADAECRYRAAITAAFPHLPLRTCRFLAEGWDSAVWEVNDDLVFRFPKRTEVATRLRIEIALLPMLGPTLPVPTPRFAYIAEGAAAFPYPFAGYPKLPGVSLADMPAAAIAPERLAAQIGGFLTALHRFPTDRAAACGVSDTTPATWRAQYATMRAALRPLFPRMTPQERARTESLFAAHLDDPAHCQFTPVLLHRDLGGDHLLRDPHTGDLTAVIDWGDVSIGDPAQDFCGLPAAWLPALLADYGGAADATFANRVGFCRSLAPYHTLVFGLHTGSARFIEQGFAELRGSL
ncbi:MAG: phosphotransferase [Chloroflexota bacterium]|nr:phosphotransferase [Chloroflexota bacterium]